MISGHQEGICLKKVADLTGKEPSTLQSIIKKWEESKWLKGRSSNFASRDANKLKACHKIEHWDVYRPHFKIFLAKNAKYFGKTTLYKHAKKIRYTRRAITKSKNEKQAVSSRMGFSLLASRVA